MSDVVEQLTRRIRELEGELATVRQRHDEWLSIVSHDFRGPLTLIIGYGEKLLRTDRASRDPARRIAWIESSVAAARRLDTMIDQVVDGAHLDDGRLTLIRRPTDLSPIIREAARAALRQYPTHPLRLDLPESLPLVDCDESAMAVIFSSLLTNAVVFSPDELEIELSARLKGDRIAISVTDHGVGLTEDERGQIFGRRFRPDRVAQIPRRGLGISLWIAKEVVRLSDGEIIAESDGPDLGTTITVEFPADPTGRPP